MIVSSKQANYASKIESVKNRIVCSNLNIHHTYGTPQILPKLGNINNLYIKTFKKESEPFAVPVKNVKSRTTAKVSVLHRTNHQANVNILKANLGTLCLQYNGIVQGDNYFCWKVSVIKIHKVSVSMNKVQGALPLQQCLSFSLSLSFLKRFFLFLNYTKALNRNKWLSKTSGLSPWQRFL